MRLTVEELLDIDSAREAALSDDGRAIAFCVVTTEDRREVSELRVVAIAAGDPTQLIAGVIGRAPVWSPDGEALAFLIDEGGRTELRLLALADRSSRSLATFVAAASRPAFSPDGDRIALVVETEPAVGALVVVALSGGVDEIRAAPRESFLAPSWSPDGIRLAFSRSRPGRNRTGPTSAIEVWELGRGALPVETGCAFATCPSWSPDGATIAFIGVPEPRLGLADPALRPWLVPAEGGTARPAAGGPEGVVLEPAPTGPIWSAEGDALYLRLARAGAIELVHLGLEPAEVHTLVDGSQVLDFSIAAETIACTVIAPDDPGSVHLIDAAGSRPLTASLGEWSRRRAAAMPHRVWRGFADESGKPLDGWLAGVDSDLAPQPTLLALHGGPHGFFGPGFQRGHFYRDVLASHGWVVLTLNSTGSGSYGRDFADALRGEWGERDLPQQMRALDQLLVAGIADPGRLSVAGYSYGGYLAACAIARSDRFQAAVIGAPIADLESFEQTSDIGSWYTPWQMQGGLPKDVERYRRFSPLHGARAIATPTLILHGKADRRVPFEQGELLRDRLAAAGAEVELVGYPGADHLFYAAGEPTERLDFNRRIVDWLETKVNGGQSNE